MNSDFNLKGVSWKKVIAFVLCLTMLVPSSSVFAAGKSAAPEIEVYADTKASTTGDASAISEYDTAYEYTGKAIKPEITVISLRTGKEMASKYYTIKYGTYDKKGKFKAVTPKAVGHYYAVVTFKGKYKDSVKLNIGFYVGPQKVQLNSVKATGKNKTATVKWKKQSTKNVTEYQVGYSSNRSFANDQRIDTKYYYGKTAKNTVASTKISGYYPVKYYVRVRAYKNITYYNPYGDKYTNPVFSDWSVVKSVKLK